jgi:uncharacterized protein (PEP-CTERM system associated)
MVTTKIELNLEFLQNHSERLSVASRRNGKTGVYLWVNEDFEYRIGANHSRAVGSAKTLFYLRKGLLTACGLLLSTLPAFAQNLQIEPSISTKLTVVHNDAAGSASNNSIFELQPKLGLTARGARLKIDGDVGLQIVRNSDNSANDRETPTVRLGAHAELIEKWLFLDASAGSEQSPSDPFELLAASALASGAQTYRYYLSPFIQRDLSPSLALSARSENTWVRRNDTRPGALDARTSEQRHSASLEWRPHPVGAALEVSSQRSRSGRARDAKLDVDTVRAVALFSPDEQWQLGVSAGRERSKLTTSDEQISTVGWRLRWLPSERTDFSINTEKRFFGWGGTASVQHRTPYLAFALRLFREPGIQRSPLLLSAASGDTRSLLDAIYATRFPNPAERAVVVSDAIDTFGLPDSVNDATVDVFPDYVQLQQGGTLSASWLGRLTTASVGLNVSKATRLLTGDEPDPSVAKPELDNDNRQWGLFFEVDRRFSPRMVVGGTVRFTRITGLGNRVGDVSREVFLGTNVKYKLSPQTAVLGGLQHRKFTSTVRTDQDESTLFVGANHRF